MKKLKEKLKLTVRIESIFNKTEKKMDLHEQTLIWFDFYE